MTTTSAAVRQLSDRNSQGTQMGASTTDLIGFYGQTPLAQRAGGTGAGVAVTTTASTSTSPVGYSTTTQANAIVTLVNEMRATLVGLGLHPGT